jgi:ABC-type transport system involved in multi-copper enzyme maturation permease subunit
MNLRRITELVIFDLRWSLLKRKGLMFLLPFSLLWYSVIKSIIDGKTELLQSSLVAMLLGTGHEIELISYLFTKPAEMSSLLILALYSTPMFALLAANDLYASDIGRGYFRLLITRVRRSEIFIARYLSVYLLVSVSITLVGVIAVVTLSMNSDYELMDMVSYLGWILLILLLYMAPFLAYMAIISSYFNSAISSLLMGIVSYTVLIIVLPIANFYMDANDAFSYLIPGKLKPDLMAIGTYDLYYALAALPAYTIIYLCIAWLFFSKRNL